MTRNVKRAAPEGWEHSEGLEDLYRRYAPWLGATLRKQFGPRIDADAEDVVHEAYVRLAPHDTAEIKRPQALLARIASNLARDLLRRRSVRTRHVHAVVQEAQGSPNSGPLDELLFKEMILSIPEPYRDVFVLSRFQRLTYEEIATRCGLSVKTVEWRLGKAIAHCMSQMRD
ncbi:RNA polymerase sigma factor [Caulobacter hibisci]|uniref:RNA polymerase sigma factor n=1 Tax=Caulobacter hibisci TaxID=2035993 RepID=A0ABS0T2P4_9CAUL|nr:RNA polymerase sigma factor [Caulobacter hibisci]MBI1685168.1 RNA polymerase sigma factor [Caulobacter hibisci]